MPNALVGNSNCCGFAYGIVVQRISDQDCVLSFDRATPTLLKKYRIVEATTGTYISDHFDSLFRPVTKETLFPAPTCTNVRTVCAGYGVTL